MLLLLCFLCLSGCNYEDEDQVKKYVKKARNWCDCNRLGCYTRREYGAYIPYCSSENNKNIQFRVEVDGLVYSRIKGDEYQYGKTYEEYKKFKPMLEEIKKLGYVEPENKKCFSIYSGWWYRGETNGYVIINFKNEWQDWLQSIPIKKN